MEPTITVETTNNLMHMILSSGLFGVIALPVSTLMLLGGTIGLLFNKTKAQLHIWTLGTLIKFNLLCCALVLASGLTKYGFITRHNHAHNLFIDNLCEMMGGVSLLLFIALIAFIVKTIAEVKQKYQCQQIK